MTIPAPLQEERLHSKGVKIFVRSWHPKTARGVVVICHGVNAHSGHYVWVGEQLVARDFAVYALDLRGRGRSEGERLYIEHVDEYVSDVAVTIASAKSRYPGLPVFLLGHSAGGVVSSTYVLDHQAELAGFICESFAFQVPAPGFALSAIKGISHIAPRIPVLKNKLDDFSRDPKAVEALKADALVANEAQPAITVAALVRADERLEREFPTIKLPLLILHGTDDKVTVCKGSQFFYETAGSNDKTLKIYEGHYHDLLNDLGKEQVLEEIRTWIEARLRKS